MPTRREKVTRDQVALAAGFASGIEKEIDRQLKAINADAVYEPFKIPYTKTKTYKYTPDFVLPNGIILETKGYFTTEDRVKALFIKEQRPDFDIRFIFQNAKNKISKNSATTYALWCDKHGFKWAHKTVPVEWVREPKDERRIKALRAIGYELEK